LVWSLGAILCLHVARCRAEDRMEQHVQRLRPRRLQDDTNATESFSPRIVGGVVSERTSFFVHVYSTALCGGSLISPEFVLTAAHCVGSYSASTAIFIGSSWLRGDNQAEQIPMDQFIQHPDYIHGQQLHDVALVKLTRRSRNIPVAINRDDAIPIPGTEVTAYGFGDTQEDGEFSNRLRKVNVDTFSSYDCFMDYGGAVRFDMHMCAGLPDGGKDSCKGDSGGPLLDATTNVQYGITSFGVGCARPEYPGVYTRVSAYADWIDRTICDNSDVPPAMCASLTYSPTESPTISPTSPTTDNPTNQPTGVPWSSPTKSPTLKPSDLPTLSPSFSPSKLPSRTPSLVPSIQPSTVGPTSKPSDEFSTLFPISSSRTDELVEERTFRSALRSEALRSEEASDATEIFYSLLLSFSALLV